MAVKVCDYKDFAIYVSDYGSFSADGIDNTCDTMEKMKAMIDRETAIKYIPVNGFLISDTYGKHAIESVKVTRPHNNRWGETSYWITDKNKRRSTSSQVFVDSHENRAIAAKILEKYTEQQKISAELKMLKESMDRNFNLQPQNKDVQK